MGKQPTAWPAGGAQAPVAVVPPVPQPSVAQVAVHDALRQRFTATHPQNTEPTRTYRIVRGQYTRREFPQGDKKGKHVHYEAGKAGFEVVEMTDLEADKFGRKFLVEVTKGGIEKPTAEQIAYVESQKRINARVAAKGKE